MALSPLTRREVRAPLSALPTGWIAVLCIYRNFFQNDSVLPPTPPSRLPGKTPECPEMARYASQLTLAYGELK
jgi:hypothetical protein